MELLHASSDNTESDKICRICMNGAEDLYSIFETGRIGQQYNKIKDILTESTSMEVNSVSKPSKKILFKQNVCFVVLVF